MKSIRNVGILRLRCSNCFYWEKFDLDKSMYCHRYPVKVSTRSVHWCGEWLEKLEGR